MVPKSSIESLPPASGLSRREQFQALVAAHALVVSEHENLRGLLEHALRLAYEEPTRGAYMEDLKQRLRDLVHAFAAHLESEENVLGAIVGAAEWRARLHDDHALQRILLGSMLQRVESDTAPGSLAFEARRFSRRLLEDMAHEERDLTRLIETERAERATG